MEFDPIKEPWLDSKQDHWIEEPKTKFQSVDDSIHRVYWTAFWGNLGLAAFKISIGAFGYSRLLVIDGLNSGANAVVITIILFGIHMSRPHTVSEKYPSSMGKARYILKLIVGFLLSVAATFILATSIKSFFYPISTEPVGVVLAVALISIMGNLMILFYIRKSGTLYEKQEIKKIMHLQTLNIGSSIVVANSVLVTGLFGWYFSENIGTISISLVVVWLSIQIIRNSLDGVMDRSSGQEIESRLTDLAFLVNEVKDVKFLRTRRVGLVLLIDLQICLEATTTIAEADKIVSKVRKHMADDLKGTSHVITIYRRPI